MALATICASEIPPQAYAHPPEHDLDLTRNPGSFRRINQDKWVKPVSGGLWTSTITHRDTEGFPASSTWTQYERSAMQRDAPDDLLTEIIPHPDARILLIDSQEHLIALREAHPAPPMLPYLVNPRFAYPDWSALAAHGWDAAHLTDRGRAATHNPSTGPNLYSWDVECVLWFQHAYTVGKTGRIRSEAQAIIE